MPVGLNLLDILILLFLSSVFSLNFSVNLKEFFLSLLTLLSVNLSLIYAKFSFESIVYINSFLTLASFFIKNDRLLRLYKIIKVYNLLKKIKDEQK